MDKARTWLTRMAAPIAFLAAATILVVLIQRALDTGPSSSSTPVEATDTESVRVTTEPSDNGTTAAAQKYYRIKQGDNLEGIAAKFSTTVDELLVLNPKIDPLALAPGKRIRVS